MANPTTSAAPLTDRFGRQVTYLRLSVTDRCDLRCAYCMAERMVFLPKSEVLSLEELEHVANAFIVRGVRKIRVTGGEPLVRKGIMQLMTRLGEQLGNGLDELTLTTNGTLLSQYAQELYDVGVRRVNVSLDSLSPEMFLEITRRGALERVLAGIEAARGVGLKVKINTVALKHQNANEIPSMIEWAHSKGMDLTLIEVMPLGDTGEDRIDQYIPMTMIRDAIEDRWNLSDLPRKDANGGPSTYSRVAETGGRVGFITPLTQNFCAGCNRVRVTCTGRIYMCLGQDDHIDLRDILRSGGDVNAALDTALGAKPERHDFEIGAKTKSTSPTLSRHMSLTGG